MLKMQQQRPRVRKPCDEYVSQRDQLNPHHETVLFPLNKNQEMLRHGPNLHGFAPKVCPSQNVRMCVTSLLP